MKHLLDVNLLIAGIVQTHSQHAHAVRWLSGKEIVLCPIVELGFLRISTNNKSSIGLTMDSAREVLEKFAAERAAERIPDDLPALASRPRTLIKSQITIWPISPRNTDSSWRRSTRVSIIRPPK